MSFLCVWFNGAFIDDGKLPIDPSDRGLLLGDGVFETLAVFDGHAVWLADHVDRMMKGAQALGLAIPRMRIEDAISSLLARMPDADGILRVTATRGPGARGLGALGAHPSLLLTLAPWTKGTLFAPARLVTSAIRRNETSPASRLKTLSYADNILAAREANERGADDALMLNGKGFVACTTISNVIALRGDSLVAPPEAEGALPGITQARVFDLIGKHFKLRPILQPLTMDDLFNAKAVFLTNSIRLIRPVVELDNAALPPPADDLPRQIFTLLCEAIAAEAGVDPRLVDAPWTIP